MLARRKTEVAALAIFLVIALVFLSTQFGVLHEIAPTWNFGQGQSETKPTGRHPYVRPDPFPWHPPKPKYANSTPPGPAPDRLVFMAKIENDGRAWFPAESLPDWQTAIHPVDSSFARLHPGAQTIDRGRVASAYLKYIIEEYHNLPKTTVFMNPTQTSQPSYDKLQALQDLNVDFIQSSGFANLRCMAQTGCQHRILPMRKPPNEFRTLEVNMAKAWDGIFGNDQVPLELGTPCCSEFAVSRDQIQKRKVDEYERYWEWLNKTIMDDDTGGMVFEYLWHVIFGKEPIYCPELEQCECDLYGKC
ncbi:hypothetical protein BS50DRAFT_571877 [Corynespora cassiicola Philippines]|uniref:Uncharacterized protein n=1 Tax=Corynespora cassiicola Philippines TaxID=1448308 RepID=A0A2T2NTF5_CORCC|nr:hypothetical protein BS50DRAFT_571877 [Corynespora cassiicola Philippines]